VVFDEGEVVVIGQPGTIDLKCAGVNFERSDLNLDLSQTYTTLFIVQIT